MALTIPRSVLYWRPTRQLDYGIEGYWLAKRCDFGACSNCPWLNPAAGQVVQVRSVYAGFVSASFTVVANGINPASPRSLFGDPEHNYFSVARSRNGDCGSANTNRSGGFDFQLAPRN